MNFKDIGHSFRGACFKFQLLPVLPFLINYSQKFSSIEDWTQLHGANEKALLGGIWPIRGRHSGPITGCIWLRYSQLISPLGAAVCGTSIFLSSDADATIKRRQVVVKISANERPGLANQRVRSGGPRLQNYFIFSCNWSEFRVWVSSQQESPVIFWVSGGKIKWRINNEKRSPGEDERS